MLKLDDMLNCETSSSSTTTTVSMVGKRLQFISDDDDEGNSIVEDRKKRNSPSLPTYLKRRFSFLLSPSTSSSRSSPISSSLNSTPLPVNNIGSNNVHITPSSANQTPSSILRNGGSRRSAALRLRSFPSNNADLEVPERLDDPRRTDYTYSHSETYRRHSPGGYWENPLMCRPKLRGSSIFDDTDDEDLWSEADEKFHDFVENIKDKKEMLLGRLTKTVFWSIFVTISTISNVVWSGCKIPFRLVSSASSRVGNAFSSRQKKSTVDNLNYFGGKRLLLANGPQRVGFDAQFVSDDDEEEEEEDGVEYVDSVAVVDGKRSGSSSFWSSWYFAAVWSTVSRMMTFIKNFIQMPFRLLSFVGTRLLFMFGAGIRHLADLFTLKHRHRPIDQSHVIRETRARVYVVDPNWTPALDQLDRRGAGRSSGAKRRCFGLLPCPFWCCAFIVPLLLLPVFFWDVAAFRHQLMPTTATFADQRDHLYHFWHDASNNVHSFYQSYLFPIPFLIANKTRDTWAARYKTVPTADWHRRLDDILAANQEQEKRLEEMRLQLNLLRKSDDVGDLNIVEKTRISNEELERLILLSIQRYDADKTDLADHADLRRRLDHILAANQEHEKRLEEMRLQLNLLRKSDVVGDLNIVEKSKEELERLILLSIRRYDADKTDVADHADLRRRLDDILAANQEHEKRLEEMRLQLNLLRKSDVVGDLNIVEKTRISKEELEHLILLSIRRYDADKTGLADHALEPLGGSVINTRCSETYSPYTRKESLFGIPFWYSWYSPRTVIQPGLVPGQCWAFKGSEGYLVVQLSGVTQVSAVSYEHIPVSLSPDGHIDSAPRRFQIWGLMNEKDEGVMFGEYEFDKNGPSLQTFSIQNPAAPAVPIIEMRIVSNHGHPVYTCLYRLRVHGVRVRPAYGNSP